MMKAIDFVRKIQNKIFEKYKSVKEPKTVTLEHYSLEFKTADGEIHQYTKMPYGNPDAVLCSLVDYYILQKGEFGHIQDDDGVKYLLKSIIWIKNTKDDVVHNVIEQWESRSLDFKRIWYTDFEQVSIQ